MKMEDVTGGQIKIGSTVYNMVEAKFGGVVVWPLNAAVTYQVVSGTPYFVFYNQNEQMVYSADKLKADGSLHAKMFGDVRVLENGVVKQTLPSVELHLTLPSASPFTIIGNSVYGNNLGTTETPQQSSAIYVNYETSFPINGGTLYQEANVRTVVDTDYGEWQTISDTPTGNPYDYHVDIDATQYTHRTSSDECSAAGGSTQLYFPSGTCYHLQAVNRTRTRTVTENCTYTATGSTIHAEPQQPQTETVPWIATIEDTPTVTIVSGDTTAFHLSTSTLAVTIDSRGRVSGSQRSMTFRATNSNVTADVTVYQEANVATTTYTYDLSIAIDYNGNLPYTSNTYVVTGRSKRTPTTRYTSGAPPETGNPQSTQSTVSVVNCTAHDGNNNPVTYVSGDFGFALSVTQNGSSQRTVNVTITADADNTKTASDSRTQEAQPAAPYISSAELRPFIATFNGGNFVNGHTYVMFDITGAYNVTSATLQSVNFLYKVNNGVEYTIPIGQLQVTQQSSSDMPELVPASGYTLPLFKANETYGYNDRFVSGDTVYVRFTVGDKGIIDTLTLPTDTSFTIT